MFDVLSSIRPRNIAAITERTQVLHPQSRIRSSFEAELLTLFRVFEFLDDRIEYIDGAKLISYLPIRSLLCRF